MRSLSVIVLLMVAMPSFGQTQVDVLKQEIDTLLTQERPLEAVNVMKTLVGIIDTSEGYASYKTRIGLIYHSLDSIEQAREWYSSVMNDSLIVDHVDDFWLGDWEVKGNYKHVSCYQMAVTYYEEGDYDQSIKYYKLALDSFPYYHFSGSDINKTRVKISTNIADLYSRQNDLETAFVYLEPHLTSFAIYSDRARRKAARIIKDHNLQDEYLSAIAREPNTLIDNEQIVLKLGEYRLVIFDLTGKNKTKEEIEKDAVYCMRWLTMGDFTDEFK